MGCGRVGTALATELDSTGYEVVVIDRDKSAFGRLPADFGGRTVAGVGFDREVLSAAGVDGADAFAAVSSGDNSNIIAARVAREKFGVERVIARIYDARRAEVYERLGIATVATVPWATGVLGRFITGGAGPADWRDRTGEVSLIAVAPPAIWVGTSLDSLAAALGGRVAALTRFGTCHVPQPGALVQADDTVHITVLSTDVESLPTKLDQGPADD